MWTSLFIFYVLLVIMVGVLLAICWAIAEPEDRDSLCLFWFPHWIIRDQKERFNKVGYIIISIFSNLIFAPSTIIAISIIMILFLPLILWALFVYLFEKKEK